MLLPPLYHWSPRDRRLSIQKYGLMPGKKSTCISGLPEDEEDELTVASRNWRAPYVCLSTSPRMAWSLSGDIFGEPQQLWDLWEVRLESSDEVHIRPTFGPRIEEIRIHNRIHKRRVWWTAERTR